MTVWRDWAIRKAHNAPSIFSTPGDIKLKISRLLGEDGRPRIEASDVLPFKLFRTEIFEEQVQFRERVGDCRATEKSCAQILASPLLDCSDGVEKIEGALAADSSGRA